METTAKPSQSTGAKWAVRILTVLLLLAFVPSAVMKLVHAEQAVEGFGKMGISEGALVPIGIVELICVASFLIPRTVVLGAFLLTGYLGGATMANIVGGTGVTGRFDSRMRAGPPASRGKRIVLS